MSCDDLRYIDDVVTSILQADAAAVDALLYAPLPWVRGAEYDSPEELD